MSNENKSGNFLRAIKKYNEEERAKTVSEMEAKKAEAVKKAEAKGKSDSDRYIKKLLSAEEAKITGEYAVKNVESQGKLFKARDKMVNDVFERCTEKLKEYTETAEYKDKIISYAREIADIFGDNKCILYFKPADLKYESDIKAVFQGDIEIKEDISIRIGGIKGFCEKLRVVADNTLDSKLENKKSWFMENADLKISL